MKNYILPFTILALLSLGLFSLIWRIRTTALNVKELAAAE